MSKHEQGRFARAVLRMMQNEPGIPESSEYFRLASRHGWAQNLSVHGQESFPGWHRAYLCEFEASLRMADRKLGEDGSIRLPYWDWTVDTVFGETIPKVIRDFFAIMPDDLVASDNLLKRVGYSDMYPDWRILTNLRNAHLNEQVNRCFYHEEHFMFASMRWRGDNLEALHNSVLLAIGFPLACVQFAAFHPLFFLHLCNIDRIYDKFLDLEPDSEAEMRAFQQRLQKRKGDSDRHAESVTHCLHPTTGAAFCASDAFNSRALGYSYDRLPEASPLERRVWPTFAVFYPVHGHMLCEKSFELHVFVVARGEEEAGWRPPTDANLEGTDWARLPGYAGWVGVLDCHSGEGTQCREQGPFALHVDVTSALSQVGLRPSQAVIRVVCVGVGGGIVAVPSGLPVPTFRGPFFEGASDEVLARGIQGADVEALQKYLVMARFFEGTVEGMFDDETELALRRFQGFFGLVEDGICGPRTKAVVRAPLLDARGCGEDGCDIALYKPGQLLKLHVDICPGYLAEDRVHAEFKRAADVWAAAANIRFSFVHTREEADMAFAWTDHSDENLFFFDGKGGALTRTKGGSITFDESEYWVLSGDTPHARKRPFELLPVAIHVVGRALGLKHSSTTSDLMSPYYVPGRVSLSARDAERVRALYCDAPSQSQVAPP